ncbi:uncharacterized protein PAC_12067 [Phialocephala subalpina]|uniref:Uncharacterized protein n=1 Tax=Phialocephala subalpina TaxID=576137 RepID=A0A1L7XAV6_9HELO|nr:uncharacterized protein PAC_12067 [Phialocephala subalpina]
MASTAVFKPPLSQGVAYSIVLGSGVVFALTMNAITWLSRRYLHEAKNTILETIRIRFGTSSHLVFFAYGVSVQILITAALNVATGASTIAINYLIPFGVVIYTCVGGLKSTFLSDYVHTVVIFVILLITMFKVMASSSVPILGSPGKLWDFLQPAAISSPAVGAKDGSYLTMDSGEGLLLAGVILVSVLEASAVVKGYFYGAFAWFPIPLGLCATMSFFAVVLQDTEYWPASGGVTAYQINNALILPLAAQAIMGIGGVFMAVTSSSSASIVAHALIVTYDIYQPYINPKATDKQLRLVSHLRLAGFAIFSSSFATALNSSGVSMGWILEFLGVVLGSAVSSTHASPTFITYAPPHRHHLRPYLLARHCEGDVRNH